MGEAEERTEKGHIRGGILDGISTLWPHKALIIPPDSERPYDPADKIKINRILAECDGWCRDTFGPRGYLRPGPSSEPAGARWCRLDRMYWFAHTGYCITFLLHWRGVHDWSPRLPK